MKMNSPQINPFASIDPTREIRVFALEPGSFDDELTGRFLIVSFDPSTWRPLTGSIEWEAISYAWGDQTQTEPIAIDGSLRLVTRNVVSLLRDLRRPVGLRYLWIDGVCINQDDLHEKSQQVAIMLRVYQNAKAVIIWLKAFRFEIRASLAALKWMESLLLEARDRSFDISESLTHYFDRTHRFDHRPVWNILRNPWFTRIWVVQEAAVAQNLFVFMSSELVSWDRLVNLAFRFVAERVSAREVLTIPLIECYRRCLISVEETPTGKGVGMIYLIERLRLVQKSSTMLPPSEIAYLAAGRKATLPHDMIYAMNGLFQLWAPHFPVEVDYSLAHHKTFRKFTIDCIEHEKNLDILSQIRVRPRGLARATNLGPSWVMDWAFEKINWYQRAAPPAEALERSSITPALSSHKMRWGSRGGVLELRGFIVDEMVSRQTEGDPFQDVSDGRRKAVNRLPRLWRDGAQPNILTDLGDTYYPYRMKSGVVAFTFRYEDFGGNFVCYLVGARHPMILRPVGRGHFTIEFGICIIDGFEDGKGLQKCLELGLEEKDILLI
ncbi:heterokaryon incompatibility protein-domain-containing protein [Nemania sp. FL0031]|nr:heterokaryon incompatibility protein-domain-containing protein [Nemania sp. FL0031]